MDRPRTPADLVENFPEILLWCGRTALEGFHQGRYTLKEDHSLVTETDKLIEGYLGDIFDHPEKNTWMIGEETRGQRGWDYIKDALRKNVWIIDPIDGTAPFANGLEQWGISMGWASKGEMKEGLVYFPLTKEIYWSDQGVSWQGKIGLDQKKGDLLTLRQKMVHPQREWNEGGMVALSQKMARQGGFTLTNPVQAHGAFIYSMVSLLKDQCLAYLADFSLWDAAGIWPIARNLGITGISRDQSGFSHRLDEGSSFFLDPEATQPWKVKDHVLFTASQKAQERLFPLLPPQA